MIRMLRNLILRPLSLFNRWKSGSIINRLYSNHNYNMSCQRLSGKVAVVTASTEGIGFSIAKRLASEGASVVVSSRKQQKVDQAVSTLKSSHSKVDGIVCHVGNDEDRKKLVKFAVDTFGGVDILVSNAAVNPVMCEILDTPESAWEKIFDINVKAAFLLTQTVVPYIEKRGGGSIVYVSSVAGYQPMQALGAYSVSKTALLGLTKAVALQCVSQKIRVNCLCPGIIQTKFSENLWSNADSIELLNEHIPMKRIGTPDECAGVVAFLCSDDASYITGESILATGGYFSRL